MRKKATSMTLTQDAVDFIDHIAEINSISRSQAVSLISEMVQDYFSDSQIKSELSVRGVSDARRKSGDK